MSLIKFMSWLMIAAYGLSLGSGPGTVFIVIGVAWLIIGKAFEDA